MHVLVTGATGFVGKALVQRLLGEGHSVAALVRSPERARAKLGSEVELIPSAGLRDAVEGCEAIVNLAGEPILPRRWTAARKKALWSSRIGTTEALVEAIRVADRRPAALLSASAVGYYGERGEELLTEASEPGTDFLAHLARDWEEAARRAEGAGVRVALLRSGTVLGREGGALESLLPIYRAGMGGPLGSGRQFLSWVHLMDLLDMYVQALDDESWSGPINAVAPAPVSSRDFARALGKTVGRPAFMPAPAIALRLLLGEASGALLQSQRVAPERLRELAFDWRFPTLEAALADAVEGDQPRVGPVTGPVPDAPYLASRPPRAQLLQTTVVDGPIDEVFDFYARPQNAGILAPPSLGLEIGRAPPVLGTGSVLECRFRVGPMPVRWRERIERYEPESELTLAQLQGPYRCWWHEHRFREEGGRTVVEERVLFTARVPSLSLVVAAPMVKRLFAYRAFMARTRFPARERPQVRPRPERPSPEARP